MNPFEKHTDAELFSECYNGLRDLLKALNGGSMPQPGEYPKADALLTELTSRVSATLP